MPAIFGFLQGELNAERQATLDRYALSIGAVLPLTFDDLEIHLSGRPIWRGQPLANGSNERKTEIATEYRQSGLEFIHNLEGSFALAISDKRHRKALLAVDRMGIERLTYSTHEKELLFCTSTADIAKSPGFDKSLNEQALFNFLFMHMVPAPESIYQRIYKLPLASLIEFEDGNLRHLTYWRPNYNYSKSQSRSALSEQLRHAMQQAIADSGVDDKTGAFLSGGLDSSSVAGTLSEYTGKPVKTFTVGFGEAEEYDELEFSRMANEHFGCDGREYQMTAADIVDVFPRIAQSYDEPFGNSSAAPTYFCAKFASDNGINHLLAGDGGDELFGGNERYTRQSIFEIYGKLPRWLRDNAIDPLAWSIAPESKIVPLRKFRSYVEQARIPLPARFESWNYMYREGRHTMLTSAFASAVDQQGPVKLMQNVWESAPSNDLLDRMLWYDWRFTLADNDLRKVGTMSALAGVRVSYPMLHPAVVNLSTQIPSSMKIRGNNLRDFFKRAMHEFLPRKILAKRKHGFGLPFGLWLKTDPALGDLVYSAMSDLKKRQIIDPKFLDNLIEQHRSGHASYFGYAIWDLAMLEVWLAHHIDRN